MARGKHHAKATARRAQLASDRIASLKAEIAAETDALTVAETELEQVNAIRAELERETLARTDETADRQAALRAEADFLASVVHAQAAAQEDCQAAWDRLSLKAIRALGDGARGMEALGNLLGVGGYLIEGIHAKHNESDVNRALAISAARGERDYERAPEHGGLADAISFVLRREYHDARAAAGIPLDADTKAKPTGLNKAQQRVYDDVNTAANRVWNSHSSTLTIDAIHAWHPLPALNAWGEGDSGLVEDLGIAKADHEPDVSALTADEWPRPTAALPSTSRERLAVTNAATLLATWKDRYVSAEALATIFAPHGRSISSGPRHPRPGYGEILRGTYAKSALGAWSRSELSSEGVSGDYGRLSVALAAAATFWLPAGQTHAFADSEPLDEQDLAELLLPFPQVFLAFAEPLELRPRRKPTREEAASMRELDRMVTFLTGKKDQPLSAIAKYMDDPRLLGTLPVDQVMAFRGARVEGLVLMSDSLGRVEDRFGWCVSIPSGSRGSVGRYALPAALSESRYRSIVENLIAVTSWAKWHEPDAETSIPSGPSLRDILDMIDSKEFKRDAARTGAGGVRVLNVKATTSRPHDMRDSTRHVAPHVRRAHWRRQRFGPGSKQVRRIRIAPVLVNAHRGEMTQRVYVLPTQLT